MPIILAWLGRLIVTSIGSWILTALVSVGVGFAAHKAGVGLIDSSQIMSTLRSPPGSPATTSMSAVSAGRGCS